MTEANENHESDALRALGNMRGGPSPELSEMIEKRTTPTDSAPSEAATAPAETVIPVAEEKPTEDTSSSNTPEEGNESTGQTETAAATAAEEGKGETKATGDSGDIFVESDIFGGKKVLKKEQKENTGKEDLNFESIDQVQSYLKDSYQIDDIQSLGTKIDEWKKSEVLLSEATEKVGNAEKLLQSMHPDLYQAVLKDMNGQDWKSDLSKSGLDFSKEVDSYKAEDLIENFYPGEITAEEWEEYNDEDGDPTLKKTIDILLRESKSKFSGTKESRDTKAKAMVEDQYKHRGLVEKSIDQSASLVASKIDGVDENYVKGVVSRLKKEGVNSLFYNENGTFKEDTVLKFIMAEEGFALFEQQKQIIERQTETKVNQDILSRGASAPSVQSGKNQIKQEGISEEAQKTIDSLRRLNKEKIY